MQVLLAAMEAAVARDQHGLTLPELEALFRRQLPAIGLACDALGMVHDSLSAPLPSGHRGLMRLRDRIVTVLRILELEEL